MTFEKIVKTSHELRKESLGIVLTTGQHFVSSIQSRHCVVCNGYSSSHVLKVEAFYKTSWKWFSFSLPPRNQKNKLSPCHLPTYFKKIVYFLLCTMKLKNLMHWKWETKTQHAKRGAFFRRKNWLYPNHFLKRKQSEMTASIILILYKGSD